MKRIAFGIFLFALCACSAPGAGLAIDYAPKNLRLLPPEADSLQAGQPIRVIVVAQAPLGDIPRMEGGSLPDGAALSDRGDGTALFAWTPVTAQVGKHTILLKASTPSESVEASWVIEVKKGASQTGDGGLPGGDGTIADSGNHAPTWNAPAELWVFTGFSADVTITPTDADGDLVFVTLQSAPAGVTLTAAPYRLEIAPIIEGPQKVELRVSDGTDFTDYVVWIHAQAPGNYAPAFTLAQAEITISGGQPWILPIAATDPNSGDTVQLSVVGPAGMGIQNNSAIVWQPPHHGFGHTTILINAADGVTVTTHELGITVLEAANTAPIVNNFNLPALYQGGLISFSAAATDTESDPVTGYSVLVTSTSLGALPNAQIDSNGWVSWRTPAGIGIGLVYFTVSATDSFGATGSRTKAQGTSLNAAPVISAGSVATATRGVAWTLTLTASDPDIEAVSFEVVTGPTGMSPAVSSSPLSLTWTPSNIVGDVPLGIVARDPHGARTFWNTTLTVINRAPVLSVNFPQATACLGRPLLIGLGAGDADGDALSLRGNTNDFQFVGNPVTAGVAAFSDFTAQPIVQLGISAIDGFGGTDFAAASYPTYGWRSTTHVPNRISTQSGFKSALAGPVFNGANVTGETYVAWGDYEIQDWTQAGVYSRSDLNLQRLDALGCPEAAEPIVVDYYLETKRLGAITSSPYAALIGYTVSDTNTNPPCTNNSNAVQLAATKFDTGTTSRVCIQSHALSVVPDPKSIKFGGNPEDLTKILCYGYHDTAYHLACRVFDVTGAGTLLVKTWDDRANIEFGRYAIAENAPGGFYVIYETTGVCTSGSTCARAMKISKVNGAILVGPSELTINGGIINPKAVAFDDGTAVYSFLQGTNVWLKGQQSNGNPGGSFTVEAAGNTNDSLVAKPGSQTVFATWTAGNQIKVQSLQYVVGSATIASVWNSVSVSTGGVNRNSRAFVLPSSLAVAWEEQDAVDPARYRPVVRFLNPNTGALISDPMLLSSIASTAISSFLPLNNGVGSAWLDYSTDAQHGDVAISYLNREGQSRPVP